MTGMGKTSSMTAWETVPSLDPIGFSHGRLKEKEVTKWMEDPKNQDDPARWRGFQIPTS